MKKLVLVSTKSIVVALMLSSNLNAQNVTTTGNSLAQQNLVAVTGSSIKIEKKEAVAAEFNVRAVKDFKRQFKEIENANWYKSGSTTVASFTKDNIQTRVVYLKNGRFLHSLLSYDETQLDKEVKAIVNENFKNFQITWVTEVHENGKVFYYINIDSAKKFKQVIVANGEFAIYKEYNKAD